MIWASVKAADRTHKLGSGLAKQHSRAFRIFISFDRSTDCRVMHAEGIGNGLHCVIATQIGER